MSAQPAAALLDAADDLERTRSTKGIAARALDPGKAFAVDFLRDRAHHLLAGGHPHGGASLLPAGEGERLGIPPASALLTVDGGTVHRDSCPIAKRAATWPWQARNDGPGVAKACSKCLPDGLPAEGEA